MQHNDSPESMTVTISLMKFRNIMAANEEMIVSQSRLIKQLYYELDDLQKQQKKLEEMEKNVRTTAVNKYSEAQLAQLMSLKARVCELSDTLINTDIKRINSSTQIETVRKEIKCYTRRKSRKIAVVETQTITKNTIFKMLEEQFVKMSIIGFDQHIQEIHMRLWEDGLKAYQALQFSMREHFIQKFRPLIKKSFIPNKLRKDVWPILCEDSLFIRKEYYNELIKELATVPDKVVKAVRRDLDRTLMDELNSHEKMRENMVLLVSLFHIHRPEMSYVQGMLYPMTVLLATVEPFDAFRIFCNLMASEMASTLFKFDLGSITLYCRVFDRLLQKQDHKLYDHLQNLNVKGEVFLIEWFYTFFSRRFQFKNLCKLWDLLLIDKEKVMIRLPFVILTSLRTKIMETEDYASCLQIIQEFNRNTNQQDLLRGIGQVKISLAEVGEMLQKTKMELDTEKSQSSPAKEV